MRKAASVLITFAASRQDKLRQPHQHELGRIVMECGPEPAQAVDREAMFFRD